MNSIQRDIYRRVKRATVALALKETDAAGNPYTIVGSGFCIDADGVVITCGHVLDAFLSRPLLEHVTEGEEEGGSGARVPLKSRQPYVVFYDTESSRDELHAFPIPVAQAMAKTDFDIGMVRVTSHRRFKDGFPTLEVEDYEMLAEGDEIGLCGFPLGMFLKERLGTVTSSFTRGIISSIIPGPSVRVDHLKGFQLNIAATNGNSGGPVFSLATGRVFGVLAEGLPHPDGTIVAGIVKAEPIYPVLRHDSLSRMKSGRGDVV